MAFFAMSLFDLSSKNIPPNIAILSSIALIIFSMLCAVAASASRLNLGFEHALSSRYTTISILAVAGLAVLRRHIEPYTGRQTRLAPATILSIIYLLPLDNVKYFKDVKAGLDTAAIAMAMHINDMTIDPFTMPETTKQLNAIGYLESHNLSIFREHKYVTGGSLMAQYKIVPTNLCKGAFESIQPVNGYDNAIRVAGWGLLVGKRLPDSITIVKASNQKIQGWASLGWYRHDMIKAGLRAGERSGWGGYDHNPYGSKMTAYAIDEKQNSACALN